MAERFLEPKRGKIPRRHTMSKLQNMIGMNLALMLGTLSVPSLEREEGQTLAEYALILALIAAVVAVSVIFLQSRISSLFTTIGNAI